MARYQPGQSGNPNGRPLKSRALTAILEAAGNKTVETSDGKHVAKKRILSGMFWEAIVDGKITFPDGRQIILAPNDIIAMGQFLYKQIDGPPPQAVDVTSDGEKIQSVTVIEIIKTKDE